MAVISFSDFVAGALIKASEMNTKLNLIKNLLNGNLDYDNIKDNGVTGDKMAATGTSSKVFHNGGGIALVDTATYYATDTVEAALAQIGPLVGTGGSLTTNVTRLSDTDIAFHASDANTCEVTIAANAATHGVIVTFGANMTDATGNTLLPIELNTVALSSQASPNGKYHIGIGVAGGSVSSFCLLSPSTTPAWDPAIENKIRFGTLWTTGTGAAVDFKIMVLRLN